jgi:hypothetical protein
VSDSRDMRPPRAFRQLQPIARLWRLQKDEELRMAALYAHDEGFELKLIDENGDTLVSEVRGIEPECVLLAAAWEDAHRARGWSRLCGDASEHG